MLGGAHFLSSNSMRKHIDTKDRRASRGSGSGGGSGNHAERRKHSRSRSIVDTESTQKNTCNYIVRYIYIYIYT